MLCLDTCKYLGRGGGGWGGRCFCLLLLFSLSYVTNQALLPKQAPLERRNAWAYARITVPVVWQNQVSDMCHMQHMPFPGWWLSQGFHSARKGIAVWDFLSILLCSWYDWFNFFFFFCLLWGKNSQVLHSSRFDRNVCVQVPLGHLSIPGRLKLSLMGLQSWSHPFASLRSPRCLEKLIKCSWKRQLADAAASAAVFGL